LNHYELTDHEWGVITPMFQNKPRGVPGVDDRRILNGIATRHDKLAANYLAFIKLASIRVWLRGRESTA
jgi:transposase